MRPHPDLVALIEKRLPPEERWLAERHLDDCAACRAELAEMRDLTEALQAMPEALETLPWRPARLWPAIRAGLQRRPAVYGAWRWATWVSLAWLVVMFSGIWWAGALNTMPGATAAAAYVAQPPATAQLSLTSLTAGHPPTLQTRLAPFGGASPTPTPQPLPAPAQTPLVSGTIFTGTVAPTN